MFFGHFFPAWPSLSRALLSFQANQPDSSIRDSEFEILFSTDVHIEMDLFITKGIFVWIGIDAP